MKQTGLEKKVSCHILLKTLNIENKESILKAARGKGRVKAGLLELHVNSP